MGSTPVCCFAQLKQAVSSASCVAWDCCLDGKTYRPKLLPIEEVFVVCALAVKPKEINVISVNSILFISLFVNILQVVWIDKYIAQLIQGVGFIVKGIAFYNLAIYYLINGIRPDDHGAPIIFICDMKFGPV